MSPDPAQRVNPRLQRRGALLVALFVLLDGLLRASYFHFGARAEGSTTQLVDSLLSELTSSVAVLVAFFLIVLPLSRRWPLRGSAWRAHVGPHVLGLAAYSLLKTFLMWVQRAALWPVVGLGGYDYGDLAYRAVMEGSLDVFGYALLVAAVHVWDAWTAEEERKLREARLTAGLAETRLELLQAQIQPHFLFNTLNTIAGVMYRDPETADRLLSNLSELLRANLRRDRGPEISVAEEMSNLERYLEIVRARFGDRLTVRTEVDPAALDARVPPLLLQPLVENAVRHTVGTHARPGHVDVRVGRENGRLRIRVDDDGSGIQGDPSAVIGKGVGLSNTRERLRSLYGEGADLILSNRREGGLSVELVFPYRELAAPGAQADA